MHPDLDRLIVLQRLETELRRQEGRLGEVPGRRATLDAELADERRRLDAAREALGASQKNRRTLEAAIQDLETKRSRYKTQLMEVKTNKEYTAMLHEIEGVEKEIRGKEDVVLQEMEAAESLQGTVKREEQEFKRIEEKHRTAAAALDVEQREISGQVDTLRGERDKVVAALTSDARELYERVAKRRGTGVAEARDCMCQQCHITLRLQLFVDLKKQDQVIQCPGCQRILFYNGPVPTAPAPA
jgi:predicted  nucleic acid-binding Zn-ribbon protein